MFHVLTPTYTYGPPNTIDGLKPPPADANPPVVQEPALELQPSPSSQASPPAIQTSPMEVQPSPPAHMDSPYDLDSLTNPPVPAGQHQHSAATTGLLKFAPLRVPELREGRGPTHRDRNSNLEADLCQRTGTVREPACTRCQKGAGPWTACVSMDGFLQESCANCHYSYAGQHCSFRPARKRASSPKAAARPRRSSRQTRPKRASFLKKVVAAVEKDTVLPTVPHSVRSARLRSPSASPTLSPPTGSYPYSLSPRQLDNIRRRIRRPTIDIAHSQSTQTHRGPMSVQPTRGPIADFRALLIEARGLSISQISWRKAELQRELAALTQAEAELVDREVDDG